MIESPQPRWVAVLASWLLLALPALGGEDRHRLLATARDGNRAAILSITSMECSYERRPWANTTFEQAGKDFSLSPGRFWRTGDTYRLLKPMGDGTTLDYVVRKGIGFYLRKGGPLPHPKLTSEPPRPVDGVGGEMWQYLLFSHWGPNAPSFYPFHELLQRPHVIHTVERLPPPANDIHVELSHSGGRLEFWFDPKVNYLIRKSVMVPAAGPTFRWEDEVVEFAELAPAVFVPTTVEHRCSVKGTLRSVVRTVLSGLKVNHRMAESALRLPGIAGMECIDLTRDMAFKVDADGRRVGPESPVKVFRIAPNGPEQRLTGPISWPPEPSRPPTPWWVWLLIASVLLLVVAVVLAILRRRRQALQA